MQDKSKEIEGLINQAAKGVKIRRRVALLPSSPKCRSCCDGPKDSRTAISFLYAQIT